MEIATRLRIAATACVLAASAPPHIAGADGGSLAAEESYSSLLSAHVTGGHVDYPALCNDGRLQPYLEFLAQADPARISDDRERLAFWINAYNAFTLSVICDHYPVESINDLHFGGLIVGTVLKKTVWDRKFAVVGGTRYSLNDIEHEIIRREFREPHAHFALVCAARSCPPLRSEAYAGSRLGDQLDDQARAFFADSTKNHFDLESRTAYLSKILDWYEKDFGANERAVLDYIAPYLQNDVRASIEKDAGAWHVEHTRYDWSLND